MTHLLVDVDSKIPNLALMRISKYLKTLGQDVELLKLGPLKGLDIPILQNQRWDSVWISCVFTWNRELAFKVKTYYESLGASVRIGGSGVSLTTKLSEPIEAMPPDYDLYDDDRAIGFVQRGCIRKCQFCIVSQKEGRLADNQYRPLESWVPEGFNKIMLLDNEFAAMPYEWDVLDQVQWNDWKLSITQGYDLRCMTKEKAECLAWNKPWDLKFGEHRLYVAWDYFFIEPYVRRGIEMLLDAGFKGKEIMCYCLAGFNTTHDQDRFKFELLWGKYGVLPFVMRYNLRKDDPWLNAWARYVNRGPASYRGHSFEDYLEHRNIASCN